MHPPDVVRHDDDDAYLVVAADKGTAHLSDTANSVSAQYGFWLGDAFASGGSNGYDHKVEGHHRARRLGVRPPPLPQPGPRRPDAAVHLRRHRRHGGRRVRQRHAAEPDDPAGRGVQPPAPLPRPAPDPEKSFAERARLFALPRSSWKDYDPAAIGEGGGIFERAAKEVPLSPQARTLLGIEDEAPSGEDVVRAILAAPVDLLYNGGIGTYVKASTEEDADVGDRSNDRVRVDATEVRARVIGEGGNLGLTQKARLEFWQRGGNLNTDAIDNSGLPRADTT